MMHEESEPDPPGMTRSIDALFAEAEARLGRRGEGRPDPEEVGEAMGARARREAASADPVEDMELTGAPDDPPAGGPAPVSLETEPGAVSDDEALHRLEAETTEEIAGPAPPPPAADPASGEVASVPPPGEDGAPGGGPPVPDEAQPEAASLDALTTAFLEAPEGRRDDEAEAVEAEVGRTRDIRELDSIAAVAERLARDGSGDAMDLAARLVSPGVAARLAVRLGSTREEERQEALLRLVDHVGEPMAPAVAEALSGADDRAARSRLLAALVTLGPAGMSEAREMLDDSRWWVVRNGVAVLGEKGGEDAVPHLTSPLAHEDPRVRREAVMALGRIGGEDAGMLVSGMLEDPEPEVRGAAAMAAGALGLDRAQKTLQAMLETEEDPDVLVDVIRALGHLRDPGAVPALEKRAVGSFFSRPPTEVRVAAYRALAAIGTPHARELLAEAAEDKDPEVRHVARGLAR